MWGEEQEQSFQRLNSQVASAQVLAYIDKDTPTRVNVDSSSVGLSAVLVHEKNGESRVVCYASRSVSQVERRYSQTEKGALALVWAYERFHLYLYGLPQFDLVTEHEALGSAFSTVQLSSLLPCRRKALERGAKQVPFGVQVYATFSYWKESCRGTV